MIKFLERRYYKQNGGNKYHIDCNKIEQDPSLLDINKIVQYKNEVAILSGILKDINDGKLEEISKIRQIVVKIGQVGKTLEKEFGIGSLINKHNIPGFINYICLFDCYDDTYKKDLPIKQICDAPKIDSNIRKVLIMPYVIEGSIKHYNWEFSKYDILRSIIIQCIMSSMIAYDKVGFIHGDFHLDNILLKKTKKKYIVYNVETAEGIKPIKIPTNGYKIVIMDFEQSWIFDDRSKGIELFWLNLYNMISRLNWDLKDKEDNKVNFIELVGIINHIEEYKNKKEHHINAFNIVKIINESPIKIIRNPKQNLVYNPNII